MPQITDRIQLHTLKYFALPRVAEDTEAARTCHTCGTDWPGVRLMQSRVEPQRQCLCCGTWLNKLRDAWSGGKVNAQTHALSA